MLGSFDFLRIPLLSSVVFSAIFIDFQWCLGCCRPWFPAILFDVQRFVQMPFDFFGCPLIFLDFKIPLASFYVLWFLILSWFSVGCHKPHPPKGLAPSHAKPCLCPSRAAPFPGAYGLKTEKVYFLLFSLIWLCFPHVSIDYLWISLLLKQIRALTYCLLWISHSAHMIIKSHH